MEMLTIGRIRHGFLFPGIAACVTAFQVSRYLGVPPPDCHIVFAGGFTELLFLKTVFIGILCGVAAWTFAELRQQKGNAFSAACAIATGCGRHRCRRWIARCWHC
jgi:H+/Cl- antiporter ClcA